MKEVPVPDWALEGGTAVVGKGDHPMRDVLAELVDDLEPEDRRVLEMWAWERCTYQMIADHFGLAGRQGGQFRVARALKKLAAVLAGRGIGDVDALRLLMNQLTEGGDDA